MFKIEVKDLPPWMGDSINELVVLGVDRDNHAVIVPLSFVQGAADKADEMAEKASQAASAADTAREGCDTAKDGIEAVFGAFPSFSEGEAYAEDAVVTYEGRLYRFTEAKEPGEWEAEKVEAVSVVMLTDEATMKALRAAGEAEAKAEYAKQEGDTAKEKAELADEKAGLADRAAENASTNAGLAEAATQRANDAADAANLSREDILAAIASLVPTGMSVRWPERITMGNVEEQRIEVTMEPEGSPQNVVFLSDNEAVAVAPDGRLTVRKVGISTIHVVPTTNAALYKTILVCVSEPVNALYGSSYRMLADGSYRLV